LAAAHALAAIALQPPQSLWGDHRSSSLDEQNADTKTEREKMTWKNLINPLAVTTRRRVVASAILYGLSLSIRFTSAAGEEVEIPAQSVQRTSSVISIMTGNRTQLSYQDWSANSAHPVVFRYGWPPRSAGCRATCELPASMPGCAAP
jgi:hypothetical protein